MGSEVITVWPGPCCAATGWSASLLPGSSPQKWHRESLVLHRHPGDLGNGKIIKRMYSTAPANNKKYCEGCQCGGDRRASARPAAGYSRGNLGCFLSPVYWQEPGFFVPHTKYLKATLSNELLRYVSYEQLLLASSSNSFWWNIVR